MTIIQLINTRTETLTALSGKIGVSRQTLQNILNNKVQPSLLTIKKICKYFNVDYKEYL